MRFLSLAIALLLTQVSGPTATVSGTVVKHGTGEPLSKAQVTLSAIDGPSFVATTDADGRYSIPNVTPGQYRIRATRTNHVSAEFGDRAANGCGTPVNLVAGQRMTDARIAMLPAGVITGRLYDSDREGMPGVSAHALKYAYENGNRVLTVVQTVQTNDLGEYRLYGLAPGRYYVAAALETASAPILNVTFTREGAFVPRSNPIRGDRFLPTYFPGVADPAGARAVELRAGETFPGVDLTVTLSRTVKIMGRIVNPVVREGPRSLSVSLIPRLAHPNSGNPLRASQVQQDGSFEIADVLPGPYFLLATENEAGGRLAGRASVDVGNADLQNVTVEVSPGFELIGRVTVDDPKVMERIIEVAWRSIVPASGAAPSPNVHATVNTADGSFKLQGITPGDYLPYLTYKAPGDIYVKALRLGSVDVRDGVHLDSAPSQQLEIVVGNNGAVVEGTALNDKNQPAGGVTVVLVPDVFLRKRPTLYKTATTDAAGRFRFATIAPGDYKVFAWEAVEAGAWQDPDFMRVHEIRGKAVTLREGVVEQVQVGVIPSSGAIYAQCADSWQALR